MNFQPKGDRLVIKTDPEQNNIGGFDLGEGEIMKESKGIVVAVGTGVALNNIQINVTGDMSEKGLSDLKEIVQLIKEGREIKYKVGDHVLFGRYAGTDVPIEGEKYRVVREADVFGVLTETHTDNGAKGVGITGEHDY